MLDFTFSAEQQEFCDTVARLLSAEVTAEKIRARWESDSGFDQSLWQCFAEMGLTSMLATESHGGLGLDAVDFILIGQECGKFALPEPLVESTLVAVPLLSD